MALISYLVFGAFIVGISAMGILSFGAMAVGILKGLDN